MTSRGQAWFDRLIAWSPVLLLGALAALTYWLNAQVQVAGPSFDGSGRPVELAVVNVDRRERHLLLLVRLAEESAIERRLQPLPRLECHCDRADQRHIDPP